MTNVSSGLLIHPERYQFLLVAWGSSQGQPKSLEWQLLPQNWTSSLVFHLFYITNPLKH